MIQTFITNFSVVIAPGLHVAFGTLAEGRTLNRYEQESPMTEDMVDHG